jgi:hypothetical protein
MPKITHSDEKGLVTETGGGTELASAVTVTGALSVTGPLYPGAGGLMAATPVVLDNANETTALSYAANAGRTNIIPAAAGNSKVYTIPTPTAAGEYYHFISGNKAADNNVIHIKTVTTDGSVHFNGAIMQHDTDQTGATSIAIFANGSSNDVLQFDDLEACDLHFLSASTTDWYVWGWVSSVHDAATAFGNS